MKKCKGLGQGIAICSYKTGFWTLGEPIAVQKEGK